MYDDIIHKFIRGQEAECRAVNRDYDEVSIIFFAMLHKVMYI